MNFKELNGLSIRDAFNDFDMKNPTVYIHFKHQALRAIGAGRKKISGRSIIEWLRWEVFIKTGDQNFKINNCYTPHYARKFMAEFPQHKNVFELRKLRTEETGPYIIRDSTGQLQFI